MGQEAAVAGPMSSLPLALGWWIWAGVLSPARAAPAPESVKGSFAERHKEDIKGAYDDALYELRPLNRDLADKILDMAAGDDPVPILILSLEEYFAWRAREDPDFKPSASGVGEGFTVFWKEADVPKSPLKPVIVINDEAGTKTFSVRQRLLHELMHAADPDNQLVHSLKFHNENFGVPDVVWACMFLVYGRGFDEDTNKRINIYENRIGKRIPPADARACVGEKQDEETKRWSYPKNCRREKYKVACRGLEKGSRCYGCR